MNHPYEKPEILFSFEKTSIEEFDEIGIRNWILAAIQEEGKITGMIQFVFCDDDQLLQINQEFLNHDTLTDIITFNYNDEFAGVNGDIFISIDRVKENATEYDVPFDKELYRVIIHGILHLLGYDDQDDSSRTAMRKKENYYLSLLFKS